MTSRQVCSYIFLPLSISLATFFGSRGEVVTAFEASYNAVYSSVVLAFFLLAKDLPCSEEQFLLLEKER
jgi:hypothetical protein